MPGHQCYHCKEWIEEGAAHDCWTTTEGALTRELSDDLRDAWERVRDSAAELGEQRIYASHHCIMFSRKACYFFVRPKRQALELCIFLGRTIEAPQVRRVEPSSRTKIAHIVHVTHRDQVEAPITEWIREAYEMSDALTRPAGATANTAPVTPASTKAKRAKKAKKAAKATKAAKTGAKTHAAAKRSRAASAAPRRARRRPARTAAARRRS
jgi:hypothetical protein